MDNPERPTSRATLLPDGPPQEWITAVEAAYIDINGDFANPATAAIINGQLAATLHPDWGDYPPEWWILSPSWLRATITDAASYRHMLARRCDAEAIALSQETKRRK